MPDRPETYINLVDAIAYLWILMISMLGGVVAFIRKVKTRHARAWNFTELLGELFTSAFVGIMTYFLCRAGGFGEYQTAAFVGIAGHMGSRAIFLLERYFTARFPQDGMKIDSEEKDGNS